MLISWYNGDILNQIITALASDGTPMRASPKLPHWRCETMDTPIIDSQKRRRKTPADYRAIAADSGMVWLGPWVKSTHEKTWWLCPAGHRWFTRFSSLRDHHGCAKCVRMDVGRRNGDIRRYQAGDYHDIASRYDFEWIGTLPKNNKTLTEWQCSNGHQWSTTFNNIQRGHGCPTCADYVNGVRVSKPQRELCAMVDGILNYRIGRRVADVALVGSRIAIEYDCYYWHANKQGADKKRVRYLMAKGWRVLVIKASSALPTRVQMSDGIARLLDGNSYHEIVLDDWGTGNAL